MCFFTLIVSSNRIPYKRVGGGGKKDQGNSNFHLKHFLRLIWPRLSLCLALSFFFQLQSYNLYNKIRNKNILPII